MLQPIQFMFLMHIFSGLYNKSACLQVSTRGQGQRSININVFTVILTTRFSNTRFADDHFGLCPYVIKVQQDSCEKELKCYRSISWITLESPCTPGHLVASTCMCKADLCCFCCIIIVCTTNKIPRSQGSCRITSLHCITIAFLQTKVTHDNQNTSRCLLLTNSSCMHITKFGSSFCTLTISLFALSKQTSHAQN